MRPLLIAAAVLSSALVFAGDPAVDALKAKFAPQEQILLAGVLTDPAAAAEFAKDAQGGADVMAKWYGRISAFSGDYLSKQHGFNDKATEVKNVAEPAEWNMLMDTLRKMKNGGLLEQGKLKIFVGMIDDANADLKRGDTESSHSVINMGRENLVKALNEYLASDHGKAGVAEAAKERAAAQKPAQPVTAPPVVVNDPAKKQTPPATQEPPKPAPVGDDEIAKDARQQAERIRKELESGGNGNSGFEGGKSQNGGTPVVAGGGQQTVENRTGLSPAGGGTPNLTVQPPAPEGDDMAELHSMKEGVKGHKTLYATIGGGLLGGILGGLIGMIFGPVGMIIGAIAGAAAGAYGGHALGKKLWG